MSVVQLPSRPRTLAHVLLDHEQAERRWQNHQGDDCESELLDRVDALRDEARRMVEFQLGVSAEQIVKVLG